MQYLDGALGLEGWRMMFLVEDLPAIALGVAAWFYLTDRPQDAGWLEPQERDWLAATMAVEDEDTAARYGWSIRRSLTSGRVLALAFLYFGVVYGLYALSFFLPSIVAGFSEQFQTDFTLLQTGLIVAVPFVVGAVAMVLWGRRSDRLGERVWHTAAPALLGGVAIPVALYLTSPLAVIAAITVCAIGIFAALPVFWSLPSAFLSGPGRRRAPRSSTRWATLPTSPPPSSRGGCATAPAAPGPRCGSSASSCARPPSSSWPWAADPGRTTWSGNHDQGAR